MSDKIIYGNNLTVYRHSRVTRLDDPDLAGSVGPVDSVIFTLPERVSYEDLEDTSIHIAKDKEYLWDILPQYYRHSKWKPLELLDIIAQFQPEPIVDYSVPLPIGLEVHLPPEDYIDEAVNGASLVDVAEL